jgi:AraC-like DNA-binding protein
MTEHAVHPARAMATTTAPADLLSRLLELTRDDRSAPCIRVRSKNSHTRNAVEIDTALLALPLQGAKRVRAGGDWIDIAPGQILLVPHPLAFDIQNIPDPRVGFYTAIGIPLEDHVLSAARHLVRNPVLVKGDGGLSCVPLAPHLNDLTNWLDALDGGDLARACHSVVGIVLSLYARGHRTLLYPPTPPLSVRVRRMVDADPTREWSSADIEAELGVSGATLRRHLAAERISLREIIANSRLSHALTLLLTTRLPVKSIAARAGYASISSFVKRFRSRYGVEPSAVGGLGGI